MSTGVAVGQLIVPGRASPSTKSKQSSKKLIAWWYLPLKTQRQLVDEHNHADTADDLDWNVKYGRGQRTEPCRLVGGVRADWCAGRTQLTKSNTIFQMPLPSQTSSYRFKQSSNSANVRSNMLPPNEAETHHLQRHCCKTNVGRRL